MFKFSDRCQGKSLLAGHLKKNLVLGWPEHNAYFSFFESNQAKHFKYLLSNHCL